MACDFRDRTEAGQRLALAIGEAAPSWGLADPVVLALPRGGVPVAFEIARRLRASLDLVMVRKIGVPWHPELAAGAVVDGDAPQRVLNPGVVAGAGLSEADLAAAEARELAELHRRRTTYLGNRAPVPLEGRDAIIVDDGVATGATVRAALRGVRGREPRSLTLALPVGPADTVAELRSEVDHAVCLATPPGFYAIGAHYGDFSQLSDAEVVRLLDAARAFAEPTGSPPRGT